MYGLVYNLDEILSCLWLKNYHNIKALLHKWEGKMTSGRARIHIPTITLFTFVIKFYKMPLNLLSCNWPMCMCPTVLLYSGFQIYLIPGGGMLEGGGQLPLWPLLVSAQSAECGKHTPEKFPAKFPCTLRDWRESRKVPWLALFEQKSFLKIWSPRLPEMVFTAPHCSRLYKVVPRPHKTSTCSKLFACHGKILLIYLSTSFAHII